MPVPGKCAQGDSTPQRFSRASVGVLGTGVFPGSGRGVHVAGAQGVAGALPPLHTPAGHHTTCGPGSRREQAQNTDRRPFSWIRVVFKQNFDLARVSFMEKILSWGVGKINCGPGSVHLLLPADPPTCVH